MDQLIVAETFYSLQCEGRAIGTPAVFLRLGGCNLLCQSDTWVCDTIDVWKHGKAVDFDKVLPDEWVKRLQEGAHLVITGGEPLLQQDQIVEYLRWFRDKYDFYAFIEVETNGTILPNSVLTQYVRWWNVSPKLSNSGMPYKKRINEIALKHFGSENWGEDKKTIFKFVVANEGDILEVFQDFGSICNPSFYMFMPAGATREELEKIRLPIVQKCIDLGVRYSERLHIVIWNQKTGV